MCVCVCVTNFVRGPACFVAVFLLDQLKLILMQVDRNITITRFFGLSIFQSSASKLLEKMSFLS